MFYLHVCNELKEDQIEILFDFVVVLLQRKWLVTSQLQFGELGLEMIFGGKIVDFSVFLPNSRSMSNFRLNAGMGFSQKLQS